MKSSSRLLMAVTLATLAGCMSPSAPRISTIDASLPLNQAMDAVISKDEFMAEHLRPGFHRSGDGAIESYTVGPFEEGAAAIEHLASLSRNWCAQNGGKMSGFPEIPVLNRGVGYVMQLRENAPVAGHAYNMICFRGRTVLGAAAIGRNTFFVNAADFRRANMEAGASIMDLNPHE